MKSVFIRVLLFLLITALNCSKIDDNTRLIKVGVGHGPSHSQTMGFEKFGDYLKERSNGRFKVKVYHSGSLGSEKQMQELLTIGTAEMTVTGVLNIYEPLFALFEMPYLYRDREHVLNVNAGPIMQKVAQSLIPKGIRLIGFYENGFRHITTANTPIQKPADVEGLLIRTPENPAQIQTFKALGAIPTPMSFSELYTALLQGVVDGQENPLQQIYLSRFYEVQSYCAKTHHIYNSAYVLISERFWQTLNEDERSMIKECVLKSSKWQLEYMKNLDVELERKLKDEGMEFTYPDRAQFEKACQPAFEKMYEKLGPGARDIVEKIRATK